MIPFGVLSADNPQGWGWSLYGYDFFWKLFWSENVYQFNNDKVWKQVSMWGLGIHSGLEYGRVFFIWKWVENQYFAVKMWTYKQEQVTHLSQNFWGVPSPSPLAGMIVTVFPFIWHPAIGGGGGGMQNWCILTLVSSLSFPN